MFTAEYEGINDFLVKASQLLLKFGVRRCTRGNICYELPGPFMFKIKDPTARWVTIPERKWNLTLPYAESLWLATGRNDMAFISRYLKRMKDFSDDGKVMRGGYGPRLRYYNGSSEDYSIDIHHLTSGHYVDQFRYVLEAFHEDENTRRAIITIGDPNKDELNLNGSLKPTKDIPCTRVLHFQKNPQNKKLDLTVFMRSNDFLWGASAVNIFNFTFMQEYFASMLNLSVGSYYHIADNFHYYEDRKEIIERISKIKDYEEIPYTYHKTFKSLKDFDFLVSKLEKEEYKMWNNEYQYKQDLFQDPFFSDWYSLLYRKAKPDCQISLYNKELQSL